MKVYHGICLAVTVNLNILSQDVWFLGRDTSPVLSEYEADVSGALCDFYRNKQRRVQICVSKEYAWTDIPNLCVKELTYAAIENVCAKE
jgi:hypothetical protein